MVLARRDAVISDRVADLALAALCAIVEVTSALVSARDSSQPRLTVGAGILLAAASVPLVLRRRCPVVVLAACGALSAAYGIAPYPDPLLPLALLVALATVVDREPRHLAVVGVVVTAGCIVAGTVLSGDSSAADYYENLLVGVIAVGVGLLQRSRRVVLDAAAQQAAQAERDRHHDAVEAVEAERARIARELHDVVAHHVSMVVVQAEAAAATTPEAAPTFDAIADTGREAMVELRRLLGVLRDDGSGADGGSPTAPQPGLGELDVLVSSVRQAGLAVGVSVDGPPRPLPPGVDLSAYRIVQEALTNALRHAGGTRADVSVHFAHDALELAVRDDGAGPGAAGGGGGLGLVGMRERVAMLGGSMTAGGAPGGGFEVVARLPLAGR